MEKSTLNRRAASVFLRTEQGTSRILPLIGSGALTIPQKAPSSNSGQRGPLTCPVPALETARGTSADSSAQGVQLLLACPAALEGSCHLSLSMLCGNSGWGKVAAEKPGSWPGAVRRERSAARRGLMTLGGADAPSSQWGEPLADSA